MRTDAITARTNVLIEAVDAETGRVLHSQRRHNLVTTVGRNLIRDALTGTALTGPTHVAVGTSATAVTAGDTALGAEVYRDAYTTRSTAAGQVQYRLYVPSTSANGNTLVEAGLLDASSGGNMYARVTFAGVAKTSTIAFQITWTININAS